MAIIPAKCPQCGANINIDDTQGTGQCPYCGLSFVIERNITNYTFNTINITQPNAAYSPGTNHLNMQEQQMMHPQYIGNTAVSNDDIQRIRQYINRGDRLVAIKFVRELTNLNLAEARDFVDNFDSFNKNEPHLIAAQRHQVQREKKNPMLAIVISICIFVGGIFGIASSIDEIKDTSNDNAAVTHIENEATYTESETTEETVNNRYETEISWALEQHLAIAVAIDDYNGDIVAAGTYRFYPDSVVLGTGKIPTVWDIYVSNKIYNDISQLHDDNPDFVGCVGGLNKDEITVTLEEGQYIYVKHYKVANNNPTGILMVQKIED